MRADTDNVLQVIRNETVGTPQEDQLLFLEELEIEIAGMLDALKREMEEDAIFEFDMDDDTSEPLGYLL